MRLTVRGFRCRTGGLGCGPGLGSRLGRRMCWFRRGSGLWPWLGFGTGWLWCGSGFWPWLWCRAGWLWCGLDFRPRLWCRAGWLWLGPGLGSRLGRRMCWFRRWLGFRSRLYSRTRWLHRLGVTRLGRRVCRLWRGLGFRPWLDTWTRWLHRRGVTRLGVIRRCCGPWGRLIRTRRRCQRTRTSGLRPRNGRSGPGCAVDAGVHDSRSGSDVVRRQGFCSDNHCWPAMVDARELLAVLHGLGAVRNLRRQGAHMLLAHGVELTLRGPHVQAAAAAVIADAVVHVVVDHRGVVDVGDVGGVDVVDRAVVHEAVMVPVATVVAGAGISIAVGDAAIEANVGAPVAGMPAVAVAEEAPPAGGPERADEGSKHPDAGHPSSSRHCHPSPSSRDSRCIWDRDRVAARRQGARGAAGLLPTLVHSPADSRRCRRPADRSDRRRDSGFRRRWGRNCRTASDSFCGGGAEFVARILLRGGALLLRRTALPPGPAAGRPLFWPAAGHSSGLAPEPVPVGRAGRAARGRRADGAGACAGASCRAGLAWKTAQEPSLISIWPAGQVLCGSAALTSDGSPLEVWHRSGCWNRGSRAWRR